MICPKCNAQLPEGLNFCTKCGNPLGATPAKKAVPAKGLLLGGCGCAFLVTVLIGIVIVLAFVMIGMQRRGPGAAPQPTVPTQPVVPTTPPPVEQPTVPVTPPPEAGGYPELKQGEYMLLFAKDITADGMPVGTTTIFSTNEPQIVQVFRWGPNTVSTGSYVLWGWYYNGNTLVWGNYGYAQEGYVGIYDKVARPANGFPAGEYTVMVAVNGTPVISHKFTVQ